MSRNDMADFVPHHRGEFRIALRQLQEPGVNAHFSPGSANALSSFESNTTNSHFASGNSVPTACAIRCPTRVTRAL